MLSLGDKKETTFLIGKFFHFLNNYCFGNLSNYYSLLSAADEMLLCILVIEQIPKSPKQVLDQAPIPIYKSKNSLNCAVFSKGNCSGRKTIFEWFLILIFLFQAMFYSSY